VKIVVTKDTLYFGHFYPYCPHLLCDFGEILYNRSAHNAVDILWVSLKSDQGNVNEITFTRVSSSHGAYDLRSWLSFHNTSWIVEKTPLKFKGVQKRKQGFY